MSKNRKSSEIFNDFTYQNIPPCNCNPERIADKVIFRIHRAKKQKRRAVSIISAAAIMAVAVTAAFILSPPFDIGKIQTADSFSDTRIFSVPVGATAALYLSDGTRLIINSGSEVTYPKIFTESERKIHINGEAYLNVAKDSIRPFIVETSDFNITVHGTEFNVNTNGSEYERGTVLVEGSVEISDNQGNSIMMKPGQMASATRNGICIKKVDTENYTCWINGYIRMDGRPLKEIARKLSGYYGIPIECKESSNPIYGKLELQDDIDNVLDNIKLICPVNISRSDKGYVIEKKHKSL